MNTPSSKGPKRFTGYRVDPRYLALQPEDGGIAGALLNPQGAQLVGEIVAAWVHLEEGIIDFLALLLGQSNRNAADPIFRSIMAPRVRIDMMRRLLQASPINKDRGPEYDEILDEYEALNRLRNDYVHGHWFTGLKSGGMSLSPPSADSIPMRFLTRRVVTVPQIANVRDRIQRLYTQILILRSPPPLPDKPSQPPPSAGPSGRAPRTKSKARRLPPQSSEA